MATRLARADTYTHTHTHVQSHIHRKIIIHMTSKIIIKKVKKKLPGNEKSFSTANYFPRPYIIKQQLLNKHEHTHTHTCTHTYTSSTHTCTHTPGCTLLSSSCSSCMNMPCTWLLVRERVLGGSPFSAIEACSMCVFVCVSVLVSACICMCKRVSMCTCVYAHAHVCVCVCVCVCVYTCINTSSAVP